MQRFRLKHELQVLMLMMLGPVLVEALDPTRFTFEIPGVPLSLGRLLFIACGGMGLLAAGPKMFRINTVRGMILVAIGAVGGGLFSGTFSADFSRAAGFLLLAVGACGVAVAWDKKWLRTVLEVFFVVALAYWTYYIFSFSIQHGFGSYGRMYAVSLRLGTVDLLNHHIPGLYISVSTAFVALRYFYTERGLKLQGYLLFGLGMVSCFLLESRSNFLFTACTLLLLLVRERKNMGRFLFLAIPAAIAIFFVLNQVAESHEMIGRRFSIEDMDYQSRTNSSRLRFLQLGLGMTLSNPFGVGFTNVRLEYGVRGNFLVHNQYLTFIIAGGLLALIGVFFWLKDFVFTLRRTFFSKGKRTQPFLLASVLALFTFYTTLLTIDVTGLFFFLLISLATYISSLLPYETHSSLSRRAVFVRSPWPSPSGSVS